MEQLAQSLIETSGKELIFWSGVGFLNGELPETLRSTVGSLWSAAAAKAYLSYLSVTSSEWRSDSKILVILAAPCHPDQLHGLTLLADAQKLSAAVLLEQRKPKSLGGVFDKRSSTTGSYLQDIGLQDLGWLEWDDSAKAKSKLAENLEAAKDSEASFFVACCRDEHASEEPLSLLNPNYQARASLLKRTATPKLQSVFGRFLSNLEDMVPSDCIFWAPAELEDGLEFRRQLKLFRKLQQGSPGRPVVVLSSPLLPQVYADIRDWCEGQDKDGPIFLIHESGLPLADRKSGSGLTDSLLLMSIPGLNLCVPADEEEAKTMFVEADSLEGPSAMVFCQSPAVGLATNSEPRPGQGRTLREGSDLVLVAIGSTVFPSLLAAESLQALGVSVAVVDLRYRRPLDSALIERLQEFPLVVAVDEHPEVGGIAGHLLRGEDKSSTLVRLCVEPEQVEAWLGKDESEDLTLEHFGLHAEGIARTVREALKMTPPATFT